MSTLEATRNPLRRRTRFRTGLRALGGLTVIGAAALIFALSGNDHTNPHPAIATHARPYASPVAAQPAGPAGNLRDPTTHRLTRLSTAGAATTSARSGQPTLRSVLRSLTPTQRRYVLGIVAMSPSQRAAAFGIDQRPSGLTERQARELRQLQRAAAEFGLHPGVFGTATHG